MDSYIEHGPRGPKSELERLGNALNAALVHRYDDLQDEVSTAFLVNGDPQTVTISFKISAKPPSPKTAFLLNHFHEDVQDLLEEYGIDHTDYDIEFQSIGETEQLVTIKNRE